MFKGIIERFSRFEGIGSIRREDGRIFPFHISSVINKKEKAISEGDIVVFDIGRAFRELKAIYVLLHGSGCMQDQDIDMENVAKV